MSTPALVRTASFAALALGALSLAAPVRAEEPAAPAAPKALAKVKDPFLDSLVGTWDLAVKGPPGDMKGTDTWWKAADDTAYVRAMHLEGSGEVFDGFGVVRVGADGKAFTLWWFDSSGMGGMAVYKGKVGAEGYEAASEDGGMKIAESLTKSEGGRLKYTMAVGGETQVTGTWTKAAKVSMPPEPKPGTLAALSLVKAQIGEWTVTSTHDGKSHTGKARFYVGVGGHYVIQEYDVPFEAGQSSRGVGVSSFSEDGKTMRSWWFGNYIAEPLAFTGPATDKGWVGTGKAMGVDMKMDVKVTDAGIETVLSMNGTEYMRDTYTRPKPAK